MADGLYPNKCKVLRLRKNHLPFDYKLPGANNTQKVLEISRAKKDLGVTI